MHDVEPKAHAWKFDVDGRCVDVPTEPADFSFQNKVRVLKNDVNIFEGSEAVPVA